MIGTLTNDSMLDGIALEAFSTGETMNGLFESRYQSIPTDPGVYLVVRKTANTPKFRECSPAGWFKGKDPSYPAPTVTSNWVERANIVYIGKAAGRRGLRQRIGQLIDFGYGKPVGHRGGRLLWHIEDFDQFEVCWQVTPIDLAESSESKLIDQFRRHHGVRPFANMAK